MPPCLVTVLVACSAAVRQLPKSLSFTQARCASLEGVMGAKDAENAVRWLAVDCSGGGAVMVSERGGVDVEGVRAWGVCTRSDSGSFDECLLRDAEGMPVPSGSLLLSAGGGIVAAAAPGSATGGGGSVGEMTGMPGTCKGVEGLGAKEP